MSAVWQSGLADIRSWVSYMGVGWCGEVADAEAALEHSTQAVRYLLVGKDDCVRKATKVRPALHCGPEPLSPGLSRDQLRAGQHLAGHILRSLASTMLQIVMRDRIKA